ncbi:MAG: hypothetical protein HYV63_09900 [Candidatus Schekmanbacteria bacterium]|nr:hypothetical protein [Candidatus Schekmanbacteria bacterium]
MDRCTASGWRARTLVAAELCLLLAMPGAALGQTQQKKACAECHEAATVTVHDIPDGADEHKNLACGECHTNIAPGDEAHEEAMSSLTPDDICARCHKELRDAVTASRHESESCDSCHGDVHGGMVMGSDGCGECHEKPAKALGPSVHGEDLLCTDCHADVHELAPLDSFQSPVSILGQIGTCGDCHKDSKNVREFRRSVHGEGVLKSGLAVSASCATCHGSHDVAPVEDKRAKIAKMNVPSTCGGCHKFVLAGWTKGIHGRLWKEAAARGANLSKAEPVAVSKEGEATRPTEPPVCTSCHPGHEIVDPRLGGNLLDTLTSCRECHPQQYDSYRDSFHGKAAKLGLGVAATCADCHSAHKMLPAKETSSTVHPDNLQETCGKCHGEVTKSFVQFEPHFDPTSPARLPVVHYIWLFMTSLLIAVFAFFSLHTLLWFQRSLVGFARGELAPARNIGEVYIRRFRPFHIGIHLAIVVTFLLLAATGLPLKFSYLEWAQPTAGFFGGPTGARWLHRIAGVLTFAYSGCYLVYLIVQVIVKKRYDILWGWKSMAPSKKDLADLMQNIRWFLYVGDRPRLDRWTYWEKFDFFAVFWGVPIIGFSGLMLWFPRAVTSVLPGWTLNIAYIVHSDEALLATGFIFFFHFFHTHMRPESFPLDPVIFTGRMPLHRFQEERPLEYERLTASGELERLIVPPPMERTKTLAYLFGFAALGFGLLLGIFLIVAGLQVIWH